MALGLTPPWEVSSIEFDPVKKRLDMNIDFLPGSSFACPVCKSDGCKAHDTKKKTWRHLDFFQYEAYINSRTPRIKCEKCGIRLIHVPWARPGSGFTLLFEAMIMTLAEAMPVKTIGQFVNEHDTRLWRVIRHYVAEAREEEDYSNVRKVGMDETSSKRGHNYVSLFVDLEKSKVLFATEGKDASTVQRFKEDMINHQSDPNAIEEMCSDMSPAFIKGVSEFFPNASLTFDKFHTMKIVNEAVDEVRRQERKDRPELAKKGC